MLLGKHSIDISFNDYLIRETDIKLLHHNLIHTSTGVHESRIVSLVHIINS